jgi:alpha-L-fucosidase
MAALQSLFILKIVMLSLLWSLESMGAENSTNVTMALTMDAKLQHSNNICSYEISRLGNKLQSSDTTLKERPDITQTIMTNNTYMSSKNEFSAMSPATLLPSGKPNSTQQKLMDRGYGLFLHFGINTFLNVEWSDGTAAADVYNPTLLDCDQWVRVARDAGFRYVLLTTKHHDGFCLWDSQFTNYSVASGGVKTDVVKAVSDACRKYGLQFAVYYSLWDRHEPTYLDKDPQKYVGFMLNQLTELLTNYGEVCELWFDGGWDKNPDDWGLEQIYPLVKKLQPDCAIGVNQTIVEAPGSKVILPPNNMTEDNKYHIQYFPSDFRLWDPWIVPKHDKKQYLHDGKSYYMPFEHTICISKQWTWFQKTEQIPVRDLDELEELFYWCTDNGNSLVINIGPDQNGLIREHEANAVIALGKRLNLSKDKSLPKNGRFISLGKKAYASSVFENENEQYGASAAVDGRIQSRWAANDLTAELIIDINSDDKFNKISIFEYQDKTETFIANVRVNRIQQYTVDIWQNEIWMPIYVGDEPMGDCKVIRFPYHYQTSKIRLNILKSSAPPSIYEFNVIDY